MSKEIIGTVVLGIVMMVISVLIYIGGIAAVIYAAIWILRHFGVL